MPFKVNLRSTLTPLLALLPCIKFNSGQRVSEGTIPFTYQGETFQTYYKAFGDITDRSHTPLVALHGGPGLVHDYLVPLFDLTTNSSIPVILYDQLGNGRSTHLKDKPPTFWTIELFVEELTNLLTYFRIESNFDLIGHSWGGVLASEFEVRRQPRGLKHLVLTDSLAAKSLWDKSNMELMQAFPRDVQEGLMAGMTDPPRFYKALLAFHAVHGCTVKPFPKEYTDTLQQVFGERGDPTVASAPILNDWSIIDRLDRVNVPTLVINGKDDIAQDFVVAPFFQQISDVKWLTFMKSSHSPFWEERELYMQRLTEFLSS